MKKIEEILNFIVEIEKLKGVLRKTKPVGFERYENSAEHSWHVCLSALMLKDFANESVNIERVVKMLLIHDLGEIDAGDTIIYASETNELKDEEAAGIKRILSILPDEMEGELIELWYEFEAGETADSKFAKAVDRVPPLLHNIHGNGHSWKAHRITKDKVFSVNQRIESGSEALWSVMRSKLESAVDEGVLK
ncbi:MAG TPA: phosphohydrolase [Idiomarina abyssalis]|jgi:5'-deoxynucleotidase YfbR-like HD superfamily hydrolase|uniref:HD domain-containing protein n=1 Tax=Idiomarina TaxID=135575 RepID=UPI000C404B1C|nr:MULTISPECIES: HD domain-containing protein [Idiomarina]MAB21585.1 phosphohydrolase [Idiomarina sp.]MBH93739.1 phosphohydrolase [Idiomarina sp.]HAS14896.1 phosphohydrolase [Idiomarina abyssalis]|tara:strand:+ start:10934 stop:11512 length:579 start_codon:yes stop_codon:yes gene_type:complete